MIDEFNQRLSLKTGDKANRRFPGVLLMQDGALMATDSIFRQTDHFYSIDQ